MPSLAAPFSLQGPLRLRAMSAARLLWAMVAVALRRGLRGPRFPSWSFAFEAGTAFLRCQDRAVRRLAGRAAVEESRALIDSLVFRLPNTAQVERAREAQAPVPATWFIAERPGSTILYLHGGGYVFYPKMTENLIAAFALAAGGRTLVPSYRLAPEHPFPAALEDAVATYRWLIEAGARASDVFVAGDSAGGHLALCLCLALQEQGIAKPAGVIAISPWTDPANRGASMRTNACHDWMSPATADRVARWAAGRDDQIKAPLYDRLRRDLSRLPPLLVHGGEVEICRDMIVEFCKRAASSGTDIQWTIWPEMTHNFHGFGDLAASAPAALEAIGRFIREHRVEK
jgi:monoterpene epsilon-lactone hydrolase